MPEWRVNLLMRTPVSRVGIDCVKLIAQWSKNPIVEELKKFNRNITPIKLTKREATNYVDQDYRVIYCWKRRLTKGDFVQQWQARVFRQLSPMIIKRAEKTKVYKKYPRVGSIQFDFQNKYTLQQKRYLAAIESAYRNNIERYIRQDQHEEWLKRINRAYPEPLNVSTQQFINYHNSYLIIPLILSAPNHVETVPTVQANVSNDRR